VPSTDRPIAYRKFSGQRGTLISVEQLWAGDDHLLLVSTSFAVEQYRRFYFQDIEAFVIRPTRTQRKWVIANSICLGLFGLLTLLVVGRHPSNDAIAGGIFLGVVATLFLIALLYQLVKGPSCVSFLQLRTGLERLGAANRVRLALRMRDRLAALIGAAAEAKAMAPTVP
jgi:hypothetical protein